MNFSFDSILSKLIEKIVEKYNFTASILFHARYARILELISYMFQQSGYYVDVLFKNASITTGNVRRFLVNHAKDRAYIPYRKVGATGAIKMSGDPTFAVATLTTYAGETVFLNKYHQITDAKKASSVFALQGVTYPKGIKIVNKTINAGNPVNLGSGKVGLPCIAHAMPIGQVINIFDTKYYKGSYLIDPATTANQIVIEATYTAETFVGTEKINTGDIVIPVKEGTIKSITFTAKGIANEKFYIYSSSVDNDIVEVQILDSITGAVLQTVPQTTDLYLIGNTDSYYVEVKNDAKYELVYIKFGDGIRSAKTIEGLTIKVIYSETKGDEGNITSTGVLTVSKDSLLDTQGNIPNVYFTNHEVISDGKAIESIQSIKSNSIALFQAGYRAAGKGLDWSAIIESYPAVAKAISWSEATLNHYDISSAANIEYFSAVTNSGDDLSPSQENDLIFNFLDLKKDPTIYLKKYPLKKVYVGVETNAKIQKVQTSTVSSSLFQSLYDNYSILNTNFGSDYSIFSSPLGKIIQSDPNVIHHDTSIWHIESSENYSDILPSVGSREIIVSKKADIEPSASEQVYLQEGYFQILLKRKIAGVWQAKKVIGQSSIGTPTVITGVNSYTISTGTINFSTNKVSFSLTDIITDFVPASEPDADKLETTTVLTVAGTLLGGKYFTISSHTTNYYVWFNTGASADPAVVGKTGIEVAILVGDNAATVATKLNAVINPMVDLNSTVNSNIVTIVATVPAILTDAADFNTGFTITVTQQGTVNSTFGIINPTAVDLQGYVIELKYKTRSGEGTFLNDIRLPYFYLITDLRNEDILTTFTY